MTQNNINLKSIKQDVDQCPIHVTIECEEEELLRISSASHNTRQSSKGVENRSAKWFETNEEATRFLQEFVNSRNMKLIKRKRHTYDYASKKIYWDESTTPYVVVACETSKISPQENSVTISESNVNVTFFIIEKFPQHKLKINTTSRRKVASKIIRKALSDNDPELEKEIAYLVKFPPIPIEPGFQKSAESIAAAPFKRHILKCVSSMEEVEIAIQEFEKSTATKFIVYSNKKFDILQSIIRWDDTFTPYVIVQSKTLECQHGKDRNKAYNEMRYKRTPEKQIRTNRYKKQRQYKQRTKKMDCQAKIQIKLLLRFPQYQMPEENPFEQPAINRFIHHSLVSHDTNLLRETVCQIYFPTNEEHSGHALAEGAEIFQAQMREANAEQQAHRTAVVKAPIPDYAPAILARLAEIETLTHGESSQQILAEILDGLDRVVSIAKQPSEPPAHEGQLQRVVRTLKRKRLMPSKGALSLVKRSPGRYNVGLLESEYAMPPLHQTNDAFSHDFQTPETTYYANGTDPSALQVKVVYLDHYNPPKQLAETD